MGEREEALILRDAARHFRKRDELEAALRVIDRDIRALTTEYSRKTNVWGYTPLMLRKETKLRGLA